MLIDKYIAEDKVRSEALEDRENADRLFRQALIFFGSTRFCIKTKMGGKHSHVFHCPHLCMLRAGRLKKPPFGRLLLIA